MQMLKHRRHTRPPAAPTGSRSAVPQRHDDGTWVGRSGTSWLYAMPDLASPLWQQPEHREAHSQTLQSLLGSVAALASVVGVHLLAVAQDDPDPDFDLARCAGCGDVDPHLIADAVPAEAVPSRPALFAAGIKLLEAVPQNEQSDGRALSAEAAAGMFAGCGAHLITEQAMARIATWQNRGVDPPPVIVVRHDRRAVYSDPWGSANSTCGGPETAPAVSGGTSMTNPPPAPLEVSVEGSGLRPTDRTASPSTKLGI